MRYRVCVLVFLVVGCGADRAKAVQHFGQLICRQATDSTVISTAVSGYLDQLDPAPERFLYVPSTDSTPPDPAMLVLQDAGPTYVFSTDPKKQATVRKVLAQVGDYPTLLLAWHGLQRADPMHPIVTLGGHYVTGVDDGKNARTATIALQCDSTGWHYPSPPAGSGVAPTPTPTHTPAGSPGQPAAHAANSTS
jgi:hypothetical protein